MKAKSFLQQLPKLNNMIKNKMIEREQWKDLALGMSSGGASVKINGKMHNVEKVKSSGSQQKMADAVVEYVNIERELNQTIDKLVDIQKDVLEVIERLKPIEYDLLHIVYVQNRTLFDVAEKYKKSYSWVTTVHGRALKNVQNILDARMA